MIATIHKYKNYITAISFVLIVFGFFFGLMGNGDIKKIALVTATIIAGIPIAIKAISRSE